MTAAKITITNDAIILQAPYDQAFVRQLKSEIPSWARSWRPERKVWRIDPLYRDALVRLCRTRFDQVFVEWPAKPRPSVEPQLSWAALLFQQTPPELHRAIYRALVRALHPDVGGDGGALATLTVAWTDRRQAAA